MQVKKFPQDAMELFLDQHFLLKKKVLTVEDEKVNHLQGQLRNNFSNLHRKLKETNPHVRMVVGYGGNFKFGVETFLLSYRTFCDRKNIFEWPNNMVSFLPPEFNNFSEFIRFANQQRPIQ